MLALTAIPIHRLQAGSYIGMPELSQQSARASALTYPTRLHMELIDRTKLTVFGAMLSLALFAGCTSPEARIRQNPEPFAQLPPEQQEMIRRGEVAVGFSAEMVRLALGEPDRYSTRTDADGTSEVWSYVTYDGPTGIPLYRGWYHRYYMWDDPLYPYYLSVPERRVRDRFNVIFRNGRVIALERETLR